MNSDDPFPVRITLVSFYISLTFSSLRGNDNSINWEYEPRRGKEGVSR